MRLLLQMFLYCLVFWREVQEYKALFIGASFRPCAVEMKAKVSLSSIASLRVIIIYLYATLLL